MNLYAVYNRNDKIIYSGTASEIAKEFNCKRNSIYCNLLRKQRFKQKYTLIRIGKLNEYSGTSETID